MEEIKFKLVFDTAIGKYVTKKAYSVEDFLSFRYGLDCLLEKETENFSMHDHDAFWEDTPNLIAMLQYTGLKDKNGKEIYMGEVIELASDKSRVGVVVFNEDDFGVPCFCIREGEEAYEPFFAKGDEPKIWFEVIGNIYEHSYLLHVKE